MKHCRRQPSALSCVAVLALAACADNERKGSPLEPADPRLNASLLQASEAAKQSDKPNVVENHFVKSALRCSECHEGAYEGWRKSAHARASASPSYKAMRAHAGGAQSAGCDRCHSPFAGRIPARNLALREGVNCDGCHMVARVARTDDGHISLTHELADNVKYSTLEEAKDHYFHRVRYSDAHGESELCGGCHQYRRTLPNGETLPVYTEYQEWEAGPWGEIGLPCQTCHMQEYTGEAAVGEGERSSLKDHAFLEEGGELRSTVLEAGLRAERDGQSVHLRGTLTNKGAGHYIPTGMPARRIILRAYTVSEQGKEGPEASIAFGRVLVDAQGNEAPFYRAVRVDRDTRLAPKQQRNIDLRVKPVEGAKHLQVEVAWVSFSAPLAKAIGLTEVKTEQLYQQRLPIGDGKRSH